MNNKDTDKNKRVEKQVELTLACFDNIPVLEAGPDFYEHVRRRLAHEGERRRWSAFACFGFRKLSPAFLIIIVLFNLVTLYAALDGFRNMDDRSQNIEALAEQYFVDQARLLTATDGR